jgi:TonB family protein
MSDLFKKYFRLTAVVHVAVVVIIILIPLVLDFIRRRKPHEIVTYVDLQTAIPEPVEAVPVEKVVEPPEPPPPEDIPEPPKETPKPKKKKIEISKKRVRRTAPEPEKPQLTPEEVKKLLASGIKTTDKPVRVDTELPAWYYALVRQTLYEAWDQPSGVSASAGLVATVTIRVERNGRITRRKLSGATGVAVMDDSVMKAVNSVSKLRALPPSFPRDYKDITIYFELSSGL